MNYVGPLSESIRELEQNGYVHQYKVENDRLINLSNHKAYKPDEVTIVEKRRFEGPSDPDDMSVLYGLECNDGDKGTLVNAYGLYADDNIDDFLKKVADRS